MEKQELAPGIVVYKNIDINNNIFKSLDGIIDKKAAIWQDTNFNKEKITLPEELFIKDINQEFTVLGIPYKDSSDNNFFWSQDYSEFSKILFNIFDPIEKDYAEDYHISFKKHNEYSFLKYSIGHGFSNHIDDSHEFRKTIAISYYLNDDYEGGEINFQRFDISYKPSKNEVLVFPANYVYAHSVSKVLSGTRYCVASWLD
jgi:hypothetical protein